MELKKYKSKFDNLVKHNVLLKIVLIIEAVLIIYLINVVVTKTNSQRVVILPPQETYKEIWVSGNEVSRSYLDTIGSFVAFNLFNITKYNANKSISNILALIDSNSYYEVKKELQKMVTYIVKNNITRFFQLFNTDIKFIDNKKYLIVTGQLVDSIGSKVIKSDKVELYISYKIKFGRFFIENLFIKKKK